MLWLTYPCHVWPWISSKSLIVGRENNQSCIQNCLGIFRGHEMVSFCCILLVSAILVAMKYFNRQISSDIIIYTNSNSRLSKFRISFHKYYISNLFCRNMIFQKEILSKIYCSPFLCLIVFTSDHQTFCSLFKVRRHVIGIECINHDVVVDSAPSYLWGYPTTSI